MDKKALGRSGEALAAKYLKSNGFKVLKKNFRCPLGEIDIIAQKSRELYFVEVKTRSSLQFGSPFEAIDFRKKRQIIKVSNFFLMKEKKDPNCHFSVIGIILKEGEEPEIRFLKDAFET